ncbi:hypothetical protein F4780DRAFT_778790 [Xylariomycetidae sp. FL0641]|nr:hypothetical protein F4780DRAFT_778790 [Xylariomycetidae sp. FL0641]
MVDEALHQATDNATAISGLLGQTVATHQEPIESGTKDYPSTPTEGEKTTGPSALVKVEAIAESVASSFASSLSAAGSRASCGRFAPPAWEALRKAQGPVASEDSAWEDTSDDSYAAESYSPPSHPIRFLRRANGRDQPSRPESTTTRLEVTVAKAIENTTSTATTTPEPASQSFANSVASSAVSSATASEAGAGCRRPSGGFMPPAWAAIHEPETRKAKEESKWEDTSDSSCAISSYDPSEVLPTGLEPVGCWGVAPAFTATTLDFSKRGDHLRKPKSQVSQLTKGLRELGSRSAGAKGQLVDGTSSSARPVNSPKTEQSGLSEELERELAIPLDEWLEGLEGDYFRSHF